MDEDLKLVVDEDGTVRGHTTPGVPPQVSHNSLDVEPVIEPEEVLDGTVIGGDEEEDDDE